MTFSALTIKIILLFFPGLISWFVLEKLIISKKREVFYYIVYSFLLGFISYFSYFLILNFINLIFNKIYKVQFFNLLLSSFNDSKSISIGLSLFKEISYVTLIAFLLALLFAKVINGRYFHLIMQKMRITKRFSEPDLWSYLFNSKDNAHRYIDVRDFENKKIYRGSIEEYSDTIGNVAELLLKDVSVYDEETGDLITELDKIYLARETKNITIEFPVLENIGEQ